MSENPSGGDDELLEEVVERRAASHAEFLRSISDALREFAPARDIEIDVEVEDVNIHRVKAPAPGREDIEHAKPRDLEDEVALYQTAVVNVGVRNAEVYQELRVEDSMAQVEFFDVISVDILQEEVEDAELPEGMRTSILSDEEEALVSMILQYAVTDLLQEGESLRILIEDIIADLF